jgi:cyclopropane fatty-acyl-phospholipid synthase-like methyltransferase
MVFFPGFTLSITPFSSKTMFGYLKQAFIEQFKLPRGAFGALAGHVMARKNRERIHWAVSEMNIKPGDRILEIGYGPGTAIAEIFRLAPDCRVSGIDPSTVMYAQAERINRHNIEAQNLRLRAVAAGDYDGQDGPFDLIFAINVFSFCPDPAGLVRKSVSWLEPGGRLVIVHQVPMKSVESALLDAKESEFCAWQRQAGLQISRQTRLPARPNPVLFIEGTKLNGKGD